MKCLNAIMVMIEYLSISSFQHLSIAKPKGFPQKREACNIFLT